ncbi:MAG: DEAD/DEAH box helicase [Leptospirales bacterium]|nr:DEAD/DEAH box helicase [Leptospirales bacterium]
MNQLTSADKARILSLLSSCSAAVREKGLRYQREGRVQELRLRNEILTARVQGEWPYAVRFNLDQMRAECDCPASSLCKHLAAAAFQALKLSVEMESPARSKPPSRAQASPGKIAAQIQPDWRSFYLRILKPRGAAPLLTEYDPEYHLLLERSQFLASVAPHLFDGELSADQFMDAYLQTVQKERPALFLPDGARAQFRGALPVSMRLVRSEDSRRLAIHAFVSNSELGKGRLKATGQFYCPNQDASQAADYSPILQLGGKLQDLYYLQIPKLQQEMYFTRGLSLFEIYANQDLLRAAGIQGVDELPPVYGVGPEQAVELLPAPDEGLQVVVRRVFVYAKSKRHLALALGEEQELQKESRKRKPTGSQFVIVPATPLRRGEDRFWLGEDAAVRRSPRKEAQFFRRNFPLRLPQRNPQAVYGARKVAALFRQILPALREANIPVLIHPDLMLLAASPPRAFLVVNEGSGENWFEGQVEIPGVDALQRKQLFQAWRAGQSFWRTADGRWLRLEDIGLEKLSRTLSGLGLNLRVDGGVSNINAGNLRALELEASLRARGKAASLLKRWNGAPDEDLAIEKQPEFLGTLRSYQLDGAKFLFRLFSRGMGGILADDMGLGKTIQALYFLSALAARGSKGPVLIVAPVAALGVWSSEAQRFCPHLPLSVWHGSERKNQRLASKGVIVTSFGVLLRDIEDFKTFKFQAIVIDEAQNLKNQSSQASRAVRSLKAESIFCLTGTPLENHLGELWSLSDLCFPGILGARRSFLARMKGEQGVGLDQEELGWLHQRLNAFMLRRSKDQVLRDLPPKTESILVLPMHDRQASIYEEYRRAAQEELASAGQDYLMRLLPHLMRLRRIACHPDLHDAARCTLEQSGKVAHLLEIAEELAETTSGVLIFSQFTDMLDVVQRALAGLGHSVFRIDGNTAAKSRAKQVAAFQGGERKFFLISLRAGGVALTLNRADTVIHLDPWWNPAAENQASDRAHRIGQTRPVMIYKMVSRGSVEERVIALQGKKRALFEATLSGVQSTDSGISREELAALLK